MASDASPSEPVAEEKEKHNSVAAPAAPTSGFEMGWSEEHLCAWSKIKSKVLSCEVLLSCLGSLQLMKRSIQILLLSAFSMMGKSSR